MYSCSCTHAQMWVSRLPPWLLAPTPFIAQFLNNYTAHLLLLWSYLSFPRGVISLWFHVLLRMQLLWSENRGFHETPVWKLILFRWFLWNHAIPAAIPMVTSKTLSPTRSFQGFNTSQQTPDFRSMFPFCFLLVMN